MSRIHVVGDKASFTYIATQKRYGSKSKIQPGYKPGELIQKLTEGHIKEKAIVPVWNSNYGVIAFNLEEENRTAGVLKGAAGNITDIWKETIQFSCGIKGRSLLNKCKIFSVEVATGQCSLFLRNCEKINAIFKSLSTTTEARDSFLKEGQDGDGLLCGEQLLDESKIKSLKQNVQNPFNFTIFFSLDTKTLIKPKVSYGCFLMNLQGNSELPVDFINYWNNLALSKDWSIDNALERIPKILFVLRFEESKALVLAETPYEDGKDPWQPPDEETGIKCFGQVGMNKESLCEDIVSFSKSLKIKDNVLFYGNNGTNSNGMKFSTYFWMCPALGLCVHGFDPLLVKSCAKAQAIVLRDLLNRGAVYPKEAVKILNDFKNDEAILKLSPESSPNAP